MKELSIMTIQNEEYEITDAEARASIATAARKDYVDEKINLANARIDTFDSKYESVVLNLADVENNITELQGSVSTLQNVIASDKLFNAYVLNKEQEYNYYWDFTSATNLDELDSHDIFPPTLIDGGGIALNAKGLSATDNYKSGYAEIPALFFSSQDYILDIYTNDYLCTNERVSSNTTLFAFINNNSTVFSVLYAEDASVGDNNFKNHKYSFAVRFWTNESNLSVNNRHFHFEYNSKTKTLIGKCFVVNSDGTEIETMSGSTTGFSSFEKIRLCNNDSNTRSCRIPIKSVSIKYYGYTGGKIDE